MIDHKPAVEQIFERLFNHTTEYYPLLLIPTGPAAWEIGNKYVDHYMYNIDSRLDYYCIYFEPATKFLGFKRRRAGHNPLDDATKDWAEYITADYTRPNLGVIELGSFIEDLVIPHNMVTLYYRHIECIYSPFLYRNESFEMFEPWLKRYMEEMALTIMSDKLKRRSRFQAPITSKAAVFEHYMDLVRLLAWQYDKTWLVDIHEAIDKHEEMGSEKIADVVRQAILADGLSGLELRKCPDPRGKLVEAVNITGERVREICDELPCINYPGAEVDEETADILENKLIEFRQATI